MDHLPTSLFERQGRHGWQGPQGLRLAWNLQDVKPWQQQQHATDVADTVNCHGGPEYGH